MLILNAGGLQIRPSGAVLPPQVTCNLISTIFRLSERRESMFSLQSVRKNRPKVNGKELDKIHGLNTCSGGFVICPH